MYIVNEFTNIWSQAVFFCVLQRSGWLLALVLYNVQPLSYDMNSGFCCYHNVLELCVIFSMCVCVSGFSRFILHLEPHCTFKCIQIFQQIVFLFFCNVKCWKPTNNARSLKPTHLLKVARFMLLTCDLWGRCFSLSDCFYIRPSSRKGFSVKSFLFSFFSPHVEKFLMSFQFVSLVFNCMSKGVCIYGSFFLFFLFLFFPPSCKQDIFALPQSNAIWQWCLFFYFLELQLSKIASMKLEKLSKLIINRP